MWLAAHPEDILEATKVYVEAGSVKLCVVHKSGDLVDGLPLSDSVARCPVLWPGRRSSPAATLASVRSCRSLSPRVPRELLVLPPILFGLFSVSIAPPWVSPFPPVCPPPFSWPGCGRALLISCLRGLLQEPDLTVLRAAYPAYLWTTLADLVSDYAQWVAS